MSESKRERKERERREKLQARSFKRLVSKTVASSHAKTGVADAFRSATHR